MDLRFRVNNVDRNTAIGGFQDEVIFFSTLGSNGITSKVNLTPGTSASPIIFQNQDGSFGARSDVNLTRGSDEPEASVLVQVPVALDRIRISARTVESTSHRIDFTDLAFTPLYQVTLTTDPTNGGTVTGAGTYQAGDNVCLTATPAAGFMFVSWTDEGDMLESRNSSYYFTMPARDRALVANFVPIVPVPTLNLLSILLLILALIGIVAVHRSRQNMLNQ